MNPVKISKNSDNKSPDLLLGAQDLPTLLIDSLNGLKTNGKTTNNSAKFSKCVCQMQQQQRRSWMFGSTMLILPGPLIISPLVCLSGL